MASLGCADRRRPNRGAHGEDTRIADRRRRSLRGWHRRARDPRRRSGSDVPGTGRHRPAPRSTTTQPPPGDPVPADRGGGQERHRGGEAPAGRRLRRPRQPGRHDHGPPRPRPRGGDRPRATAVGGPLDGNGRRLVRRTPDRRDPVGGGVGRRGGCQGGEARRRHRGHPGSDDSRPSVDAAVAGTDHSRYRRTARGDPVPPAGPHRGRQGRRAGRRGGPRPIPAPGPRPDRHRLRELQAPDDHAPLAATHGRRRRLDTARLRPIRRPQPDRIRPASQWLPHQGHGVLP